MQNGEPTGKSAAHKQAEMTITVQASSFELFDWSASPTLMEVRLDETFTGDMNGRSTVRALEAQRKDKSASLDSMQRFRGTLDGRTGTFVLQGQETVENDKVRGTWSVVPESGTGGLAGLRGDGSFEGDFGKQSKGTLTYWFD